MNHKTVFIDFDGTFADFGRIPPAHLDAVQAARAAGHRVFLCTGRPWLMVPASVREGFFDGLVCAAGGYVRIDDQVLADVRFPAELGARTAAALIAANAAFLLEAPDQLFSTTGAVDRLAAAVATFHRAGGAEGAAELLRALRTSDDLSDCSFSKVAVFDSKVPVEELAAQLGPAVGALPNSMTHASGSSGELYQIGVDKAAGIRVVEAHLGLRREDIIGIGDGLNDLEMLQYAGVGVAVEESPDLVKAAAQLIVPGPQGAGVAQAFAELGLIPALHR